MPLAKAMAKRYKDHGVTAAASQEARQRSAKGGFERSVCNWAHLAWPRLKDAAVSAVLQAADVRVQWGPEAKLFWLMRWGLALQDAAAEEALTSLWKYGCYHGINEIKQVHKRRWWLLMHPILLSFSISLRQLPQISSHALPSLLYESSGCVTHCFPRTIHLLHPPPLQLPADAAGGTAAAGRAAAGAAAGLRHAGAAGARPAAASLGAVSRGPAAPVQPHTSVLGRPR